VIAAAVLAAGGASRFGSAKQLAELDGVPLLEHAIRAVEAVPAIERIVVVLGAASGRRAGVSLQRRGAHDERLHVGRRLICQPRMRCPPVPERRRRF
jgi:CTP:molybdopterin cytidylyltransferase MocA